MLSRKIYRWIWNFYWGGEDIFSIGPNLSFTAENNMVNLHKAGHTSTLTCWMRYSISSNFKNLLLNWVKYVFQREKWNFEPIGNFAYTTGFLNFRKALLILLPLYLQMLIMQISTQTDNKKYRKSLVTKKMGLKFQNRKFKILWKIALFFL